jgi:hypothetical protein
VGKTTLARALSSLLGVPMLDKDDIKESLFDALGTGDSEWSSALGKATYQVMFRLAPQIGRALLVANFYPSHEASLAALSDSIPQIVCRCSPKEQRKRFDERSTSRHPGHLDATLASHDLTGMGGVSFPTLGPMKIVDTEGAVDIEALAAWVKGKARWK